MRVNHKASRLSSRIAELHADIGDTYSDMSSLDLDYRAGEAYGSAMYVASAYLECDDILESVACGR